jgi:hypothetical protein
MVSCRNFPLRKAVPKPTIAENATMPASFAFATLPAAPQKGRAFQASSPKTFSRPFEAAFF